MQLLEFVTKPEEQMFRKLTLKSEENRTIFHSPVIFKIVQGDKN